MQLTFSFEMPSLSVADRVAEYGAENVSDIMLIKQICSLSLPKGKEDEVAGQILEAVEKNATMGTLMKIQGVTKEAACSILSAIELGRRKSINHKKRIIRSPSDVCKELYSYSFDHQENLIVCALSGAHEVIFAKAVTRGLINKSLIHPREVFADAIAERAAAIIIAHNHPSGNLVPSDEDFEATKSIICAGQLLGIPVLDSMIITSDGYYSFKEHTDLFDKKS